MLSWRTTGPGRGFTGETMPKIQQYLMLGIIQGISVDIYAKGKAAFFGMKLMLVRRAIFGWTGLSINLKIRERR